MTKQLILKIARIFAGICVAVGLLYFLYAKNVPPVVGVLIEIGMVAIIVSMRRAGVFDRIPHFDHMATLSSRFPIRDSLWALVCLVVAVVLSLAFGYGFKMQVIPDNYFAAISFAVVLVGLVLAFGFFVFRVFNSVIFGKGR